MLDVRIMRNPRQRLAPARAGFMQRELWPRIGVQFADGRRAGEAAPLFGPMGVPKDEQGLPTEPVLVQRGGGGGGTEFSTSFWLYPLPSTGPLQVFAEWHAIGLAETKVELDGTAIQAAARDAVTIWD